MTGTSFNLVDNEKIGAALRTRAEDDVRGEMADEAQAKYDEMHQQAKAAHELVTGKASSDTSPIVVLERKTSDEAGKYAIVAKLDVRRGETPDRILDATINAGIAFTRPTKGRSEEETELGVGIDGETHYYGQWLDTPTSDRLINIIANVRGNRNKEEFGTMEQTKAHHVEMMETITTMATAIEAIVVAVEDPSLNPLSDTSSQPQVS